jgi:serine/threonine-protein kinase
MMVSIAAFVKTLQQSQLLESTQLNELSHTLRQQFSDPRALARELIKRNWLTPYQVNQLVRGHGKDLLVGSYVLLERLGEGGMGQVFKARHQKLGRVVALKVIRKEKLEKAEAVRRFRREIEVAAQLSHPNVVRAFDADQAGDTHFLVLEYVDGIDLGRKVREQGPLPVEQACDYIRQAALGLQHAFARGMVHRDIKPSNLILTSRTGPEGINLEVVKVLDMGLARLELAGQQLERSASLTQCGTIMGSPDFISPEQARNTHTADIRADLYSLGCTFYYLLTGRTPFPGDSVTEVLLKHQLEEPDPVEQLRPGVPPDVVNVLNKLMAKNPKDRYQTPAELVAVLEELRQSRSGNLAPVTVPVLHPKTTPLDLPDEPRVRAQRTNPQLRKKILAVLGFVSLSLVLLFLLRVLFPRGHRQDETKPEIESPKEDRLTREWKALRRRWEDPKADRERLRLDLLDLRQHFPGTSPAREAAGLLAKLPSPLDALQPERIPPTETWIGQPPELIGVLGTQRLRHWGEVTCLVFTNRGKSPALLSGGSDGMVRAWDVATGKESNTFGPGWAGVASIALAPKGNRTAVLSGNQVRLWEAAKPAPVVLAPPVPGRVLAMRFALMDGKATLLAATSEEKKGVQIWDFIKKHNPTVLQKNKVRATLAAISRDGATLAVAAANDLHLWDLSTGKLRKSVEHAKEVKQLVFSADSKVLAVLTQDQVISLWDVVRGVKLRHWAAQTKGGNTAWSITFSTDSKQLAAWTRSGMVRVWQTANGKSLSVANIPGGVTALTFVPDGRLFLGNTDGVIRPWNWKSDKQPPAVDGPVGGLNSVEFAPSGKLLAAGGNAGVVRLWEPVTGKVEGSLSPHKGAVMQVQFAPDGDVLFCRGRVEGKLWDVPARKPKGNPIVAPGGMVAFDPRGRLFAAWGSDQGMHLWDIETQQDRGLLEGQVKQVAALASGPDGGTLACVGGDGIVRLWDLPAPGKSSLDGGGRLRTLPLGGTKSLAVLAFGPEDQTLVNADMSNQVRLWDLSSTPPVERSHFKVLGSRITALALTLNGHYVAVATLEGRVRIWDTVALKEVYSWKMPGPVNGLTFAFDSRHLATANANGTVYLLRVTPR